MNYTATELLALKARRQAQRQNIVPEVQAEEFVEVKKVTKDKKKKGQNKVTPDRTMMTVEDGEELYINPAAEIKMELEESVED